MKCKWHQNGLLYQTFFSNKFTPKKLKLNVELCKVEHASDILVNTCKNKLEIDGILYSHGRKLGTCYLDVEPCNEF